MGEQENKVDAGDQVLDHCSVFEGDDQNICRHVRSAQLLCVDMQRIEPYFHDPLVLLKRARYNEGEVSYSIHQFYSLFFADGTMEPEGKKLFKEYVSIEDEYVQIAAHDGFCIQYIVREGRDDSALLKQLDVLAQKLGCRLEKVQVTLDEKQQPVLHINTEVIGEYEPNALERWFDEEEILEHFRLSQLQVSSLSRMLLEYFLLSDKKLSKKGMLFFADVDDDVLQSKKPNQELIEMLATTDRHMLAMGLKAAPLTQPFCTPDYVLATPEGLIYIIVSHNDKITKDVRRKAVYFLSEKIRVGLAHVSLHEQVYHPTDSMTDEIYEIERMRISELTLDKKKEVVFKKNGTIVSVSKEYLENFPISRKANSKKV